MIEFMTLLDIMGKFVDVIEKQRVRKNMTQADLYKAAGMSSKSYANFISTKSTKFENIVNRPPLHKSTKCDMRFKSSLNSARLNLLNPYK